MLWSIYVHYVCSSVFTSSSALHIVCWILTFLVPLRVVLGDRHSLGLVPLSECIARLSLSPNFPHIYPVIFHRNSMKVESLVEVSQLTIGLMYCTCIYFACA